MFEINLNNLLRQTMGSNAGRNSENGNFDMDNSQVEKIKRGNEKREKRDEELRNEGMAMTSGCGAKRRHAHDIVSRRRMVHNKVSKAYYRRGRVTVDAPVGGGGPAALIGRNWARISVDPFINFLREFRRMVPKDCPPTVMKLKGRQIWRKMSKDNKEVFFQQAKRAREKGYQS